MKAAEQRQNAGSPAGEVSVAANVELSRVAVRHASFSATVQSPREAGPSKLRINYEGRVRSTKPSSFEVEAVCDAKVITTEKQQEVVTIFVSYSLGYTHESLAFSERGLNEFASVNAVFNAWPYFREFVQAASVRLGLPPIVIPLFRVPATDSGSTDITVTALTKSLPKPRSKRAPKKRRQRSSGHNE